MSVSSESEEDTSKEQIEDCMALQKHGGKTCDVQNVRPGRMFSQKCGWRSGIFRPMPAKPEREHEFQRGSLQKCSNFVGRGLQEHRCEGGSPAEMCARLRPERVFLKARRGEHCGARRLPREKHAQTAARAHVFEVPLKTRARQNAQFLLPLLRRFVAIRLDEALSFLGLCFVT